MIGTLESRPDGNWDMATELGTLNELYLLGTPREAPNPFDFYATGTVQAWDTIRDAPWSPQWLQDLLLSLVSSFDSSTPPGDVGKHVSAAIAALKKGGAASLPAGPLTWSNLLASWTDAKVTETLIPVSHCIRLLCDNEESIPSSRYPLTILCIIFGDIGACIYLASRTGRKAAFERELKDALGSGGDIAKLLDLYYMFGLAAAMMRAGLNVEVEGTASIAAGGPDLSVSPPSARWKYYVEATRKEPRGTTPEGTAVWNALDEKLGKLKPPKPNTPSQWDPCLVAIDIATLPLPGTKESWGRSLVSVGSCGELIYQAYVDPEFPKRIQSVKDGLSSAVTRTIWARKNGSGIAGVWLTRNHLLQVGSSGVAQAEGAVLVIHQQFESIIPSCIARHIYIVNESCSPEP